MPKLLIVEDNEMNRDLLQRRLERKGYSTVIAEDGIYAMEKLEQHPIDLILMDMNLPRQDGWTTCQQIKAIPKFCHIPIIALTAHALTHDRERSLVVGCAEYETKPVDFARLLEKISDLLPGSSS